MTAINFLEKKAKKLERSELKSLTEINAHVNHLDVPVVMEGKFDWGKVKTKYDRLKLGKKMNARRFKFGVTEEFPVLLVHMPDGWYVLSPDDFIYLMSQYPVVIDDVWDEVRWTS